MYMYSVRLHYFYFILCFHFQALFFGGGWVFFMRKLFKNFEVHVCMMLRLLVLMRAYMYLCEMS